MMIKKSSDIEKILLQGLKRLKDNAPDIIPIFHILTDANSNNIHFTIGQVIEYFVEDEFVRVSFEDSVSTNRSTLTLEGMNKVLSYPNFSEIYCFESTLIKSMNMLLDSFEKDSYTKEEALDVLRKIIKEQK